MASSGSTWRKHPFVKGHQYCAVEDFRGFREGFRDAAFLRGSVYEFQRVDYRHYDSSTVLTFLDEGSIEPIEWWWHDDEPDELCVQRLQEKNT